MKPSSPVRLKRTLTLAALAALGSAATNHFMMERHVPSLASPPPMGRTVSYGPQSHFEAFEETTRQHARAALATIGAPPPHVIEPEPPSRAALIHAAQGMLPAFEALLEQSSYFDKEEVYKEVLGEIALGPVNIQVARTTLTDVAFVREAYGKKQGVARVYAIQLLERAAQMGDPWPLLDTTRELFGQVVRGGESIRGQYIDLEMLIRAYLRVAYPPAEIIERGPELIKEVFLAAQQPVPRIADRDLRDAIAAAFSTAAQRLDLRTDAAAIYERIDAALGGRV